MIVSLDAEHFQEARLKSNFSLDFLEAGIEKSSRFLGGDLLMNEVAPLSVHAVPVGEVDSAFFGLVFGVGLLIFAKFMGAMCELALLLIGTEAKFEVFFAELRFFLILPYGRFIVM